MLKQAVSMKTLHGRKLVLTRDTLRTLNAGTLAAVVGGATNLSCALKCTMYTCEAACREIQPK